MCSKLKSPMYPIKKRIDYNLTHHSHPLISFFLFILTIDIHPEKELGVQDKSSGAVYRIFSLIIKKEMPTVLDSFSSSYIDVCQTKIIYYTYSCLFHVLCSLYSLYIRIGLTNTMPQAASETENIVAAAAGKPIFVFSFLVFLTVILSFILLLFFVYILLFG